MSSSFVFRSCLISPLSSSPGQVERCFCACWSLAVEAKEGKVLKESAIWDSEGPRSWPGAGVGSQYTQGLLSVGPGKGGWWL